MPAGKALQVIYQSILAACTMHSPRAPFVLKTGGYTFRNLGGRQAQREIF